MRRAAAWSVRGVERATQEIAEEAARRAGMSLGDWLDEVVAEKAADEGLSSDDMDDDDKLDAIGERLERMSRRGDRGVIRKPRDENIRGSRHRSGSSAEETSRARDLLESAVARFESRAAKTEERTAKAFESVATWIERSQEDRREERETLQEVADKLAAIETRVERAPLRPVRDFQDERPRARAARTPTEESDSDVDARLERLSRRVAPPPPAPRRRSEAPAADLDLDVVISRRRAEQEARLAQESRAESLDRAAEHETMRAMAAKLEALERRAVAAETARRPREPIPAADDASMRAMEAKLEALEQRTAAAEIARRPREPILAADDAPIRAMAAKLEALEQRTAAAEIARRPREPVPAANDAPIRAMEAKIEALEQRAAAAEAARRAPEPRPPNEAPTREMSAKREALEHRAAESVLRPPYRQPRQAVEETAPSAPARAPGVKSGWRNFGVDVAEEVPPADEAPASRADNLSGEFSALSARIDRLRAMRAARRPSPTDAEDLRAGVASMSRSVADIAPRNGAVALEGAVGDLGQRISDAREAGANPILLAPVEAMLGQVLDTLRDHDPRVAAERLERELRALGAKIEALAGTSVNPGQLEAIRKQSDDIRAMLAAAAKTPVPVERLERQIGALAERVERLANSPSPHAEIAQVLQLLADAHSQIEQSTPAKALDSIERRIEQLAGRIDEAIRRPAATFDARPMEDLARRIDGIRLSVERQSGPRPEVAALENALRDINAKLDRVSPAEANSSAIVTTLQGLAARLEAAFNKPQTAVVDARPMEELARRIEGVRASVEKQADFGVRAAKLETALSDISQKLDRPQAPAPESKALNLALKDLTAKLDEAFRKPAAPLAPLDVMPLDDFARRLDDIHSAVESQAHRNVDPSRIEAGLREVSAKLDEAFRRPAHAVATIDSKPLDEMSRRLDEIRAAMERQPKSGIESSRIEAALQEVSAKLDRPAPLSDESGALIEVLQELAAKIDQSPTAVPLDLSPIQRMLQDLRDRPVEIDTRMIESLLRDLAEKVSAPSAPVSIDTRPIESLLSRLDAKLDAAAHPTVDTYSMELTLREMLDRLESMPSVEAPRQDLRPLELAIHDLRERIEERAAPTVDPAFVEQAANLIAKRLENKSGGIDAEALINQISEIHGRLDSLNISASSNAALGRTVADLMDELETTQQILRSSPTPAASGALPHDGLAELRAEQMNADRRTEARLAALQDVLEQLVDRLAEGGERGPIDRSAQTFDTPPPRDPSGAAPTSAPAWTPPPTAKTSEMDPRDIPDRPKDTMKRATMSMRGNDGSLFLLEQGADSSRRANDGDINGASGKKAALNAHIAAARRAAQAAISAQDSPAPGSATARANFLSKLSAPNAIRQAQDFVAQHRKPVLLGGGVLVALVAALTVFEFRSGSTQPVQKSELSAPVETTPSLAATPADKPIVDEKAAKAPLDTTPVGAVSSAAPKPAVSAAPLTKPAPADLVALLPNGLPQSLREAATAGDMGAQTELAIRLMDGRGAPRDTKTAARWFELAASQGLPVAQYRLAAMYEKGIGVTRDLSQARVWYLKAANAGNARAMHNLAVVFAEDAGAGKPDYAEATRWFRKAGEYGIRDSQFNLGVLYGRGLGAPQDFVQSWMWFSLAAQQGDTDAGKKRDEVAAKLDAKGLASATKTLADFKALTLSAEANEIPGPAGGWEPKGAPPQAIRSPQAAATVKG